MRGEREIICSQEAAADQLITIPVAEYVYLQRVDALMDALLQADSYNNTQVVAAIRQTVNAMRNPGEAGADL